MIWIFTDTSCAFGIWLADTWPTDPEFRRFGLAGSGTTCDIEKSITWRLVSRNYRFAVSEKKAVRT